MGDQLTRQQQRVLFIIRQTLRKLGAPPTRVEIAKKLGVVSTNTADYHLRALARKGFIELTANRNRNIRLISNRERRRMRAAKTP